MTRNVKDEVDHQLREKKIKPSRERKKKSNIIISFGNGQIQNDYFGFTALFYFFFPFRSLQKCKIEKFLIYKICKKKAWKKRNSSGIEFTLSSH